MRSKSFESLYFEEQTTQFGKERVEAMDKKSGKGKELKKLELRSSKMEHEPKDNNKAELGTMLRSKKIINKNF